MWTDVCGGRPRGQLVCEQRGWRFLVVCPVAATSRPRARHIERHTHTYTRARASSRKSCDPTYPEMLGRAVGPLALALLLLPTVAAETRPRNAHLGKLVRHLPPVSRVASKLGNSSSIPAGGAVWPTAIFWAMVQVGTPPQDFPAAIDSGSGDLDIGAVGCGGCVTTPPNRGYDHSLVVGVQVDLSIHFQEHL